ncbi:sugar phosphate permease [Campylobacter pinnipediorum subsp. caledonicus]|uniref:Sugar phosphate permease n=1 Tax=Campylobacter pinnipediorum subsp. caledonicus TaxID=1874362 RepID=A0A1S6U5W7_9BACT|nr:MFS transporter [Campylobacter pinnipediorum]AQW87085.1 sugar phosphate permease [Campylobacter pinnipediorum subsp. caledonicus]
MFGFLRSKQGKIVPEQEVLATYNRKRWNAIFGIFIGYAAFYIIRNNFILSTPYLQSELGFDKTDIGLISRTSLVIYGFSKGFMSVLADKANPKWFMIFGLVLSAMVNLMMGFSTAFWLFFILVCLNGLFQGMGAGPAYVVLASWYPRKSRGLITSIFNTSHNVGGGLVAPITGGAIAWLGTDHWQTANFIIPVAVVIFIAAIFAIFGAGKTYNEGLPQLNKILNNDKDELVTAKEDGEKLSSWEILKKYILTDKNVWFVSFIDVFTYMIRFGVLTWLPLYLLETKGFSKKDMSIAFAIFEWSAIISTIAAGYLTDSFFKGRRMPLSIISLVIVGGAMFIYHGGESLTTVTLGAAIIGCFIYVPMFLSSLQTIELVPPFAAGSATGLRGLLSYVLGSFSGTALIGYMAKNYGWDYGFYLLMFAVVACILCCYMVHLGVMKIEAEKLKK